MQQVMEAARTATSGIISSLPAVFEQTSHSANKTRPPNKMEVFLAHVKKDPRYADTTHKQRMEMWKNYQLLAVDEKIVETRGEIGVQGPTINLNLCSVDQLERVPKLNLPVRKAIVLKRSNLPGQRFTSWDQLLEVPGIGSVILKTMKVFCMDPATSPTQERQQPTMGTSSTSGNPLPTPTGSPEVLGPGDSNPVLMVGCPTEDSPYYIPELPIKLMTLWTQTAGIRPGELYQDSGCARSCAGPDVHTKMHDFLKPYGIVPIQVNKQEEFIFGNNQVEMSDCSFIYPVYLNGKLQGAIDIARLPVPCPGLYSKKMMKQWKHVLDFDTQETHIKEFNLTYPFKDTVPILDIFQMPTRLAPQDVPPRFRATTYGVSAAPRSCLQVSTSGSSEDSQSSPPPLTEPSTTDEE